jgi:IclR family transcriptional regulator, mhp operon transcriptional activator
MRALSRGLEVLEFITRKRGASLKEVRLATGLSKSVVHRILVELIDGGFIWRGVAEARYYASGLLAVSSKGAQAHALKCAARGPLKKLVKTVQWPSDLFVRDGADMVLIDTTQMMSPYTLNFSKIGSRLPILLSSVGHVALAEMKEEEREEVYEELQRRGQLNRQLRLCTRPVDEIITDVKDRGFAVGEPTGDVAVKMAISIATAVTLRSNVIGSLNVWWPQSAENAITHPSLFLEPLKCATKAISENLEGILSIGLASESKLWKKMQLNEEQ